MNAKKASISSASKNLKLAFPLLALSLAGCASVQTPCRNVSIPPLPKHVEEQARSSSTTLSEVQQWLQSVLTNSDESLKP